MRTCARVLAVSMVGLGVAVGLTVGRRPSGTRILTALPGPSQILWRHELPKPSELTAVVEWGGVNGGAAALERPVDLAVGRHILAGLREGRAVSVHRPIPGVPDLSKLPFVFELQGGPRCRLTVVTATANPWESRLAPQHYRDVLTLTVNGGTSWLIEDVPLYRWLEQGHWRLTVPNGVRHG